MQNASQNENFGVSTVTKSPKDRPTQAGSKPTVEPMEELVLRIAQVADLAAQCDREGNPATAIALRRVAEALWGDAFRNHHPTDKSKK